MDVDIDVGDVAEGVGEFFTGFASGSVGNGKKNDNDGCGGCAVIIAILGFLGLIAMLA